MFLPIVFGIVEYTLYEHISELKHNLYQTNTTKSKISLKINLQDIFYKDKIL